MLYEDGLLMGCYQSCNSLVHTWAGRLQVGISE